MLRVAVSYLSRDVHLKLCTIFKAACISSDLISGGGSLILEVVKTFSSSSSSQMTFHFEEFLISFKKP